VPEDVAEGVEGERLVAVGERLLGVGVHLHDQAVGAGGDRGEGERRHQVGAAAGVARVHDHRQVRLRA
jgi:hypothetical protein